MVMGASSSYSIWSYLKGLGGRPREKYKETRPTVLLRHFMGEKKLRFSQGLLLRNIKNPLYWATSFLRFARMYNVEPRTLGISPDFLAPLMAWLSYKHNQFTFFLSATCFNFWINPYVGEFQFHFSMWCSNGIRDQLLVYISGAPLRTCPCGYFPPSRFKKCFY